MNRISTHVLDTTLGTPARDMAVSLERLESSGGWSRLASARTDEDGRCAQLLREHDTFQAGRYRLVFETGSYYSARETRGLYPLVEITFEVRAGESQFHIPLLLSPNGYTTYRGS
jgi:5-hydroxyisourate hydrolase